MREADDLLFGLTERAERASKKWTERGCGSLLNDIAATTDVQLEAIKWISILVDLGQLYRAGVRWGPDGRIAIWPCFGKSGRANAITGTTAGNMTVSRAGEMLRDVVLNLPHFLKHHLGVDPKRAMKELFIEYRPEDNSGPKGGTKPESVPILSEPAAKAMGLDPITGKANRNQQRPDEGRVGLRQGTRVARLARRGVGGVVRLGARPPAAV